jgi:hypothetical protein
MGLIRTQRVHTQKGRRPLPSAILAPSCAATPFLPPTYQPTSGITPADLPSERARWRRRGRRSSRARRRRSSRTAGTRCHPSSRGTSTRRPPGTRYARRWPTRLLPPAPASAIAARASCHLALLGFARTNCWTRCTGSGRRWGSCAACSGGPSPSSAPSGSRCEFPPNSCSWSRISICPELLSILSLCLLTSSVQWRILVI